jgi:thiol-disulfide isomerase/thioredoxin
LTFERFREKKTGITPFLMKTRFSFAALALAALVVVNFARAEDTHVKGAKPAHIAMGKEVKLTDYLVPGKTTIFDFWSEFCPPCRAIAPHLDKLHQSREDIAVVKIDINRPGIAKIDWASPVARQYQIGSVPQFKVFGPDGKLLAEGDAAWEMVTAWFK